MKNNITKDFIKKYGEGSIMKMNELKSFENNIIPTGSLTLDLATGIGGYPKGRIIEMFGWESSGKTTIALTAVRECQKQNGNVAYIDAEHALDKSYAVKLGVDMDKLDIISPMSLEQALDMAYDIITKYEYDLLVIDSLSSLAPQKEIEGDMEDNTIGIKARVIGKFLRKILKPLSEKNTTLLLIGQLRESIKVTYGDPSVTDYGNAPKFFASMRLKVSKKLKPEIDEGTKKNLGYLTTVKIIKNKCAAPFEEANFLIQFNKGINKLLEMVQVGNDLKIFEQKGAWIYYKDIKYHGKINLMKELKENKEFYDEIFSLIIEKSSEKYNSIDNNNDDLLLNDDENETIIKFEEI